MPPDYDTKSFSGDHLFLPFLLIDFNFFYTLSVKPPISLKLTLKYQAVSDISVTKILMLRKAKRQWDCKVIKTAFLFKKKSKGLEFPNDL